MDFMGLIEFFDVLIVDLQLDVKGCRDVYASFDKYVEVERLEGDNKYHAERDSGLMTHGVEACLSISFFTLICCGA
jgi:hypothetical protein